MFSVEHDFSDTRITLIDEGKPDLKEDVILKMGQDGARITQLDPATGNEISIELSAEQVEDLISAIHCPEGVYHRRG